MPTGLETQGQDEAQVAMCFWCVSWKSKKQCMVELSSTEAEYMALSQAAQESVWLKTFLCELGEMSKGDAVKIYEDNQGSIGRAVQESYVPQMRKAHLNEVMSAMESSDAAKW